MSAATTISGLANEIPFENFSVRPVIAVTAKPNNAAIMIESTFFVASSLLVILSIRRVITFLRGSTL